MKILLIAGIIVCLGVFCWELGSRIGSYIYTEVKKRNASEQEAEKVAQELKNPDYVMVADGSNDWEIVTEIDRLKRKTDGDVKVVLVNE